MTPTPTTEALIPRDKGVMEVADYYCPEHKYNPPANSGFLLCPRCEMPDAFCPNRFCMDGWVDRENGNQDGTESWVEQVPCQVCGVHSEPPEID